MSASRIGPGRLVALSKAMFLLFGVPSLLGSVYTHTFFPDVRLCSAVLCAFGTDRARNMEALLRKKTTPRQVLHVLVQRRIGGVAMPRKSLILCVDDEWNGLEGRKMLFEDASYRNDGCIDHRFSPVLGFPHAYIVDEPPESD